MANKEIIINANLAEEVRIAILEDSRLVDLDIETAVKAKHKGNIYKGIISNVEDGLDAAFVEIGEERQAFLALTEVRPSLYPPQLHGKKRVKASEVLSRGQEVVVQVTKDEMGNKGAAVSTYLSLPGRFVVLMHSDESGGGISRKIDSESARTAARDMLSRLSVPEHMAVIIRTAGMNATKAELFRDFRALCQTWQQIDKGAELGRAPTLLYREPDIIIRTIRDYYSTDVTKVVIDDEEEFEDALNYFKENMPDLVRLLERHRKREPIFQYYGIERALSELFDLEVKLPSGGYITIEQTEALVAIDVNSGSSTKEEDHEATVYKTNLEAADEIVRQLRLRDLGGIVVVDFIDMASRWHKRDVERRIKDLMRLDKARVKVGHISDNGTLELTRQRIRQSHSLVSMIKCSVCKGTGRVRDAQGLCISAFRKIASFLSKKRVQLSKLTVKLPVDVANLLNNNKRKELLGLSDSYEIEIDIIGDAKLFEDQIEFFEERRGFLGLRAKTPVRDFWNKQDSGRPHQQKLANGRDEASSIKNFPSPSIGPAPSLIEIDEMEEEIQKPPFEPEENSIHFDDALMEALFGKAPEESFREILKKLVPGSVMQKEEEVIDLSQRANLESLVNSIETGESKEIQNNGEIKKGSVRKNSRRHQTKNAVSNLLDKPKEDDRLKEDDLN